MKVHANAPLGPKGRETMVRRVVDEGGPIAEAAAAAGVSDGPCRKWVDRFRADGEAGLLDRSSAPRSIPHRTPDELVEAVVLLRRLRMTGAEIAFCLEMALSTVSAVLLLDVEFHGQPTDRFATRSCARSTLPSTQTRKFTSPPRALGRQAPAAHVPNAGQKRRISPTRRLGVRLNLQPAASHPRRARRPGGPETELTAARARIERSRMPESLIAPSEAAIGPTRSRRALEDARLFERYQRTGDQRAREALAARYLPLARRLARRYQAGDNQDDLVQVASIGLLKAIDRFDHTRELAFSSFAVPTIVGELKRYFRDHTWTVRVPRELNERAMRVRRASAQLTTDLGRSPTPAELARALETSVEFVLDALRTASAQYPDRLDAPSELEDGGRGAAGVAPAF